MFQRWKEKTPLKTIPPLNGSKNSEGRANRSFLLGEPSRQIKRRGSLPLMSPAQKRDMLKRARSRAEDSAPVSPLYPTITPIPATERHERTGLRRTGSLRLASSRRSETLSFSRTSPDGRETRPVTASYLPLIKLKRPERSRPSLPSKLTMRLAPPARFSSLKPVISRISSENSDDKDEKIREALLHRQREKKEKRIAASMLDDSSVPEWDPTPAAKRRRNGSELMNALTASSQAATTSVMPSAPMIPQPPMIPPSPLIPTAPMLQSTSPTTAGCIPQNLQSMATTGVVRQPGGLPVGMLPVVPPKPLPFPVMDARTVASLPVQPTIATPSNRTSERNAISSSYSSSRRMIAKRGRLPSSSDSEQDTDDIPIPLSKRRRDSSTKPKDKLNTSAEVAVQASVDEPKKNAKVTHSSSQTTESLLDVTETSNLQRNRRKSTLKLATDKSVFQGVVSLNPSPGVIEEERQEVRAKLEKKLRAESPKPEQVKEDLKTNTSTLSAPGALDGKLALAAQPTLLLDPKLTKSPSAPVTSAEPATSTKPSILGTLKLPTTPATATTSTTESAKPTAVTSPVNKLLDVSALSQFKPLFPTATSKSENPTSSAPSTGGFKFGSQLPGTAAGSSNTSTSSVLSVLKGDNSTTNPATNAPAANPTQSNPLLSSQPNVSATTSTASVSSTTAPVSTAPSFQFGSNPNNKTAPSAPKFQFSGSQAPGFNVSSTVTSSTASTANTGNFGFTFTAASTPSAAAFGTSTTSTTSSSFPFTPNTSTAVKSEPGFKLPTAQSNTLFGQPPSSTSASSTSVTTQGFSFSTTTAAGFGFSSSTASFGNSAAATSVPSTFQFGVTPNTTASVVKPEQSGVFGSIPSSGFTFGQTKASTTSSDSKPSFTFTGAAAPASTATVAPVAPASTSTFTFGQQSTATTSAPQSSFVFGATSGTTSTKSGFNFGSTTTSSAFGGFGTAATSTTSSSFAFGSVPTSQATQSTMFGAAAPQSNPPPFGASTKPATQPPAFGASMQSTQPPAFGAAVTTAQSSPFGMASQPTQVPAFGAVVTTQSSQPPAFGASTTGGSTLFRSQTAPNFGTMQQNNPTVPASFSFGQQQQQPAQAGTINFGNSASSASEGFNFSAAANTSSAASFQFGATSPPNATAGNATTGFNFGSSPQQPSFNFTGSAAPQQQPGMFSIGQGSSQPSGRRIARARRSKR